MDGERRAVSFALPAGTNSPTSAPTGANAISTNDEHAIDTDGMCATSSSTVKYFVSVHGVPAGCPQLQRGNCWRLLRAHGA